MEETNFMEVHVCGGFAETAYLSPMGRMLLTSDGETLVGLRFSDGKAGNGVKALPDVLKTASQWLDDYFGGGKPNLDNLNFRLRGTPFQQRVWKRILSIPYGETVSYGTIAKTVAAEMGAVRMSAQAVGNAVGKNPIPVIVPCHRVMGADGNMTGYAWGIDRKRFLLELEKKHMKEFGTN